MEWTLGYTHTHKQWGTVFYLSTALSSLQLCLWDDSIDVIKSLLPVFHWISTPLGERVWFLLPASMRLHSDCQGEASSVQMDAQSRRVIIKGECDGGGGGCVWGGGWGKQSWIALGREQDYQCQVLQWSLFLIVVITADSATHLSHKKSCEFIFVGLEMDS